MNALPALLIRREFKWKALTQLGVRFAEQVRFIEPVSHFDMMMLEQNARLIATDSGGVQREAYFLGIPCLTLRDETEWVETVEVGWNKLVGADPFRMIDAWFSFAPPVVRPPIFGDGTAGQRIARILDGGPVMLGRSEAVKSLREVPLPGKVRHVVGRPTQDFPRGDGQV